MFYACTSITVVDQQSRVENVLGEVTTVTGLIVKP